ncbi:hypothetical protein RJT34_30403 [Clitoria ternatea]|uniref:Uncharacterized protein n=1 Tax=Clitoria ternatea TaxID=43366 RepID=A0AAN9I1Y1_CLITE
MHVFPITLFFPLSLLCSISIVVQAQQTYIGLATTSCHQTGNSNSMRGYTCNGANPNCQAYITFRTQPFHNSVTTMSSLLGSDPSQLAEANSVSQEATFEANKMVIVPVNCSCSGNQYYQFNTSYVVQRGDSYFLIANNTFEGLSTCQALQDQNGIPEGDLFPGTKIKVPLRCACPSKNQTEKGVKYLLSYLVASSDIVFLISERFGVSTETILEANTLSSQQPPNIYPFTTLLVPLQDKPSSNQTFESSPPPPPPSSSNNGSSNKKWMYVVVGVVGCVALILLVLCAIIFRKHFGNKKKDDSVIVSENFVAIEKPQGKMLEEEEGSENLSEIISSIAQSFKVYSFKELKNATNNFSPDSCIQGSVFRGVINGDLAAIKKIDGDVSKEIELLTKVNHSNVIRLSGVSFDEGYWYLVYEYAANGNLGEWIYSNTKNGKFLSWTQRLQISLDVATGLDYLHSFTSPPQIHKDLKCENIVMDSDFRGKIANFGLARSMEGESEQYLMTRHIVGTRGYMAPEYLENGFVSTKLDVYAFGVLVLEILTGKEVADFYAEGNVDLLDFLSVVLSEESEYERLREFMDHSLQGNYPMELAIFVARMISTCIKKDPASRPEMREIVSTLSKALDSSLIWELS